MIADHIHDALSRVKKLQEIILAKKFFGGYSGRARFLSGCVALVGATVLGGKGFSSDPVTHLWGWGIILSVALFINYASLVYWFLFDPEAGRDPIQLKPAAYAVPPLAVGAVMSAVLIRGEMYDWLPGIWMCMYGLAQVTYRRALPPEIFFTGLGYMACGSYLLLFANLPFTNPWPMGITFFVGEAVGGWYLLNEKANQEEIP